MNDTDQVIGQEEITSTPEAEDTQESALPTEEQTPASEEEQEALPENASERTRKEFEKLKQRNKELAEKLRDYEATQEADEPQDESLNVLDSIYGRSVEPRIDEGNTSNLSSQQVGDITRDFIDSEGNVDIDGLNRALKAANERSTRVERELAEIKKEFRRKSDDEQLRDAHTKHPWLDPANKDHFDPAGYELVEAMLVKNMYKGVEKPLVQVADEVAKFYSPKRVVEEEAQKAVSSYKEDLGKKTQASSVSSGKGQPRREQDDYSQLRERSLKGDRMAIQERLKRAGY